MPQDIEECHAQAAACRAHAERSDDPAKRLRFLAMEQRWLWLAQSRRLADRLDAFVAELKRPFPSVQRQAGRR